MYSNSLPELWRSNVSISGKLIRSPLRLIPGWLKIRVLSGINKGIKWTVGSSINSCWIGGYEREKQHLIGRSTKEGMVVWDIGANVGFYSVMFARSVGPSGSVVAFEPLGRNVAFLLAHITDNEITNTKVVQGAIGARSGMYGFTVGQENSMGHLSSCSFYYVPTFTIDSLISDLGFRTPNLIKIDVEGAEVEVLRGGANFFRSASPEIWLALHGSEASASSYKLLRDFGYKVFDLEGKELSVINCEDVVARKSP